MSRLVHRTGSSCGPEGPTIGPVTTELSRRRLTRRRAVDLLRVATALCLAS